jgi:hypothetical protein
MYGTGICPFLEHDLPCIKKACELWDEYGENCAIVLLVKLLRNEFNK